MSRHRHWVDAQNEIVAGYDHMGYYFVQKFSYGGSQKDNDDCVYSIATDPMSTLTPHPDYPRDKVWNQYELADLLEKEGAPKEWIQAMRADEPF